MGNRKMSSIKSIRKVESFLNMAMKRGEKYFVIAKFQLNTGLRIVDVLKTKVSDIFLPSMRFREYLTLKEKKTGKNKQIKLNDELKKCIKTYIDNSNLKYNGFLLTLISTSLIIRYGESLPKLPTSLFWKISLRIALEKHGGISHTKQANTILH